MKAKISNEFIDQILILTLINKAYIKETLQREYQKKLDAEISELYKDVNWIFRTLIYNNWTIILYSRVKKLLYFMKFYISLIKQVLLCLHFIQNKKEIHSIFVLLLVSFSLFLAFTFSWRTIAVLYLALWLLLFVWLCLLRYALLLLGLLSLLWAWLIDFWLFGLLH